jgi:hypothetical protein
MALDSKHIRQVDLIPVDAIFGQFFRPEIKKNTEDM